MFEMVYALVQRSILGGGGMAGILFWRWKARDPTIVLGAPGEEATLGACCWLVLAPLCQARMSCSWVAGGSMQHART